jgi:hypothetical protein
LGSDRNGSKSYRNTEKRKDIKEFEKYFGPVRRIALEMTCISRAYTSDELSETTICYFVSLGYRNMSGVLIDFVRQWLLLLGGGKSNQGGRLLVVFD